MDRIRSLKSSDSPVKSTSISLKKLKERIRELAEGNKLRLQRFFSDELINEMARELGHDFRERVFDPATTLGLYVTQVLNRDEPCSTVVTRLNKERKDKGLQSVSAQPSAYCYARNRLPLELIQALTDKTVDLALDRVEKSWRWRDHDVYLVDGFMIRAPDTDANQLEFPQPSSQEAGLGYPVIRVVTLTSLAAKVVAHYQYGPMDGKGNGEQSLFQKTFEFLKENQIVVGDSNFDSYYALAALLERKVHCVFGIKGSRDNPFAGQDCTQTRETVRVVAKPRFDATRISREAWEKLPATVTIRIIAYQVEGRSEQKYIITTLLDPNEYPADEIAELYGLRWEAELDIRCLKSVMDLAEMRCQTPEGMRRELAVNILAYNLVALLLCDTAEVIELHPRQLSFSHARDIFIHFAAERSTVNDLEWLVMYTSQFEIKNRPRREEPREIKRRNGKYARLKRPRPSKQAKLNRENQAAVP
jgi:IS4 transposase